MFQVQLLTPHPGWVEIDPEGLWTSVVKVVHNAIEGLFKSQISNTSIRYQWFKLIVKYTGDLNAIEGLFKITVKYTGDLNELSLLTESRRPNK